jgi:hypothetical protein
MMSQVDVNPAETRLVSRNRLLRYAVPALLAISAVTAVGVAAPPPVAAQNENAGRCSLHTLKGDYGLIGSGVRGLGPGASESFATVSMVTYDGEGRFTAMGVSHGQTTGVRNSPATGTYYVNPDCTGGETTFIPGVPQLEDSFVIVDNGREVRTNVIAPASTLATANLRKK